MRESASSLWIFKALSYELLIIISYCKSAGYSHFKSFTSFSLKQFPSQMTLLIISLSLSRWGHLKAELLPGGQSAAIRQ